MLFPFSDHSKNFMLNSFILNKSLKINVAYDNFFHFIGDATLTH